MLGAGGGIRVLVPIGSIRFIGSKSRACRDSNLA